MCPARSPQPELPLGIAALIGAVLGVLLCAVLRGLLGRRGPELEGSLAGVMAAEAAITFEVEPEIEWEWVPAPWRNAFWWVKPRRGAFMAASPCRLGPRAARVRAPPGGFALLSG